MKNDESGVKITLAEVDVVEEKDMGSRFKILSFPTVKMFIGGSKEGEDYEGDVMGQFSFDSYLSMSHHEDVLFCAFAPCSEQLISERDFHRGRSAR